MNQSQALRPQFDRVQQIALGAGAAGLAVTLVGAFVSREQFFQAYLFGYVFWTGMGLGCLALMLLQYLVRGSWGFPIQRLLEAGARTLPLMALLFVPLIVGLPFIYLWARPEAVANDALLQAKSAYLNVPFFIVRTVLYFVLWGAMTYLLNRRAQAVEGSTDLEQIGGLRQVSALSLLLFSLTVTFALIDWVMSLEPHWYSSIYPLMVAIGAIVTALAFVIAVALWLATREPLSQAITPRTLNDWGSLLLAFVMIWAYLAFSQFFLMWSANLAEEIPWYLRRMQGGWQWAALFLVIFHFALPFLLLLARDLKRNARVLSAVAILLVVAELVDVFWLVMPVFHEAGLSVHWLDIAAPLGIGGIWLAAFVWQLKGRSLLPAEALQRHSRQDLQD